MKNFILQHIIYLKKLWIMLLGMIIFSIPSVAQTVTVDVSIDSLQLLIGEQTKVKLEISFDADQQMILPVIRDTLVRGIEVLDITKPDTQYLNNNQRMLVSQEYTITSFDSAFYYIPPFKVMVNNQLYESKSLALNVLSMPVDVDHPDQFFGPKDIMEPSFSWDDWSLIVWLSLLVVLLTIVVTYLILRYKDNKPIIRIVKVEPKLPPHQQAMKEIEAIKANKTIRQNDPKAYYTQLTDTIRSYIRDRFGFNALEMTSTEIIDRLLQEKDLVLINELKELFGTADLVKFAKHSPLLNENDMNLVNAIDFINQTKIEQDPNAVQVPKKVTIEEKRSRRTKILLMISIILLGGIAIVLLVSIVHDIYNLCF